jgi:S-adenosylmethionine/arginine decarboxylase-like enzyme
VIVHHHTIIVARVYKASKDIKCSDLKSFLVDLVDCLKMQPIFEPIAINGKFGFTGVIGIVTSHIAFHYYDSDQSLHLDVYSCKNYDLKQLVNQVDLFWDIIDADILFVNRGEKLSVDRYNYVQDKLIKETLL